MTAYYNEFDPHAAQWIRNLIAAGEIPPGYVDERSIADVQPDDLRGFVQCHFFAGLAGWSCALRLAGWPDDREVWTGSPPCQGFSVAGKGLGFADPRDLWPHLFRLLRACRPACLFGEQVSAAIGKHWLDRMFADMEGEGYAGRAVVVPACAVGAAHRRDRIAAVFRRDGVLDHGDDARLEGLGGDESDQAGWAQSDRPVAATGGRCDVEHPYQPIPDSERPEPSGQLGWPGGDTAAGSGGDVADGDSSPVGQGRSLGDGGDQGSLAQSWTGLGSDGGLRIDATTTRPISIFADALHCDPMADCDQRTVRDEREDGRTVGAQVDEADDADRTRIGNGRSIDGQRQHWLIGHDGKARRVPEPQSGIRLLAHATAGRLALVRTGQTGENETHHYERQGALKALGNAIVPPLFAEFVGAYLDCYPEAA